VSTNANTGENSIAEIHSTDKIARATSVCNTQLIKHVTYHTGLVFDKHKLGIGIWCICWLQNREIYITGTAPYSTGTGYSTSTVRLQSWYCPTFFCRSIVFHFSVGLRYIRLMLHLLPFPVSISEMIKLSSVRCLSVRV
jgi:hypothetical protein